MSLPPENIGNWDLTEGQISRASFIATIHRSRSFQKNSSFRPGTTYATTFNGYSFDDAGAGKAANHPVQTVNWYDCVKWCNARSQEAGLTPVYYTDAGFTQVYKTGCRVVLKAGLFCS